MIQSVKKRLSFQEENLPSMLNVEVKDDDEDGSPLTTVVKGSRLQAFRSLQDFTLPLEELILSRDERLGEGRYGKVREGFFRGAFCAVKFQRMPGDELEMRNLLAELSLLKSLRHEHLIFFHGATVVASPLPPAFARSACVPPDCLPGIAIVLDLAREGTLEAALGESPRCRHSHSSTEIDTEIETMRTAPWLADSFSHRSMALSYMFTAPPFPLAFLLPTFVPPPL